MNIDIVTYVIYISIYIIMEFRECEYVWNNSHRLRSRLNSLYIKWYGYYAALVTCACLTINQNITACSIVHLNFIHLLISSLFQWIQWVDMEHTQKNQYRSLSTLQGWEPISNWESWSSKDSDRCQSANNKTSPYLM